jgi:hypothetical protein
VRVIRKAILIPLLALLVAAACSDDPQVDDPTTVVTITPVTVATAAPASTPTPAPSPTPSVNPIAYVRVALFGVSCPGGGDVPDNLARQVPIGCKGAVTATPKKEDGTDVRAVDHGPDITWELVHGERMVEVKPIASQPFNRDVIGQRPGPFMLCATVREVTGCLSGEVTP